MNIRLQNYSRINTLRKQLSNSNASPSTLEQNFFRQRSARLPKFTYRPPFLNFYRTLQNSRRSADFINRSLTNYKMPNRSLIWPNNIQSMQLFKNDQTIQNINSQQTNQVNRTQLFNYQKGKLDDKQIMFIYPQNSNLNNFYQQQLLTDPGLQPKSSLQNVNKTQNSNQFYQPQVIGFKPEQLLPKYTIKKSISPQNINNFNQIQFKANYETLQPFQQRVKKSIKINRSLVRQTKNLISMKGIYNNIRNQNEKVYTQLTTPTNNNQEIRPTNIIFSRSRNLLYSNLNRNYINGIAAYGAKTSTGTEKKSNEDRIKIILDVYSNTEIKNSLPKQFNSLKVSYFAIFDGHGGDKCCEFLKKNLHNYIFRSCFFPDEPVKAIKEAFEDCEKDFTNFAYQNLKLVDRSGSSAIIALFINKTCYVINLGDSRALYSSDSGTQLYQITRDHKPEDEVEKQRIEKNGGKIYRDNLVNFGGVLYNLSNSNLVQGLKFPYRIFPGDLSVSII